MNQQQSERIARYLRKEGIPAKAVQMGGNVYNVVIRGETMEGTAADQGVYEINLSEGCFGFGNVEFGDPANFSYAE